MDCSLPGSSVFEILQVRILQWVAIPFSRGSSQPRDPTQVSCIVGRFFTIWATMEPRLPQNLIINDPCSSCIKCGGRRMERTIRDGFASEEESCTATVTFIEAEGWRMYSKVVVPLNWSHLLSWSSWIVKKITPIAFAAAAAKLLQSCPTLCDPIDGSPPAPPSLGFSRQEHWRGVPFPSPMHESEKWQWSRSVVSNS